MAAAGRYLTLRVRLGDAPGALAGLLALVADRGGNVLDVAHSRTSVALPLGEVDVALSMETRGRQHCGELVAAIQAAGHTVMEG
jgi:threonine dehydratase